MWRAKKEWGILVSGWIDGKFKDINTKEIQGKADEYTKIV